MSENFKKEFTDAMTVKNYGIDYSYLNNENKINKSKEEFEAFCKMNELETKKKLIEISEKSKDLKIEIIEKLEDYQKIIAQLPNDPAFPIFYRGQNNANYLLNPSAFRSNPETENKLLKEFSRRFPDEIKKCNNAMEKLVLMQHYGLHTRCLDITEAPLPALYFACADFKKFTQFSKTNMDKWGEIVLFKAKDEDEQKYSDSHTVSIMANTAFQNVNFAMIHIEICYKQDNHLGAIEQIESIKHILRHSVIVRTPQDNPRIKNQQGAFILVNSNNIVSVNIKLENEKTKEKKGDYLFNKYIADLDEFYTEESFLSMIKKDLNKSNPQKILTIKDIIYEKAKPYSQEKNVPSYIKNDPFDINRLFYRDSDHKKLVILIPPYAKEKILKELAQNNIREDFIYPDMDTVSNELNNTIGR